MQGMTAHNTSIERYVVDDFDKSIAQVNLGFAKKVIKVCSNCHLTRADIENFKFSKSKDENVKYTTKKDGFVACIRLALIYYGGII